MSVEWTEMSLSLGIWWNVSLAHRWCLLFCQLFHLCVLVSCLLNLKKASVSSLQLVTLWGWNAGIQAFLTAKDMLRPSGPMYPWLESFHLRTSHFRLSFRGKTNNNPFDHSLLPQVKIAAHLFWPSFDSRFWNGAGSCVRGFGLFLFCLVAFENKGEMF